MRNENGLPQASGGKGGGIAMKRRKFVQAATGGAVAAAVLGKAAGNTKDLYDYRFPLRDLPLRTLSGSDVTVPVQVIGELRDELQGALLVPGGDWLRKGPAGVERGHQPATGLDPAMRKRRGCGQGGQLRP